jgi:glucose uptake protein GlcU
MLFLWELLAQFSEVLGFLAMTLLVHVTMMNTKGKSGDEEEEEEREE